MTTKTEEEEGAAWEFESSFIVSCIWLATATHTRTHVYLYMCTDVYKSLPLSISLTLRGYLCIAEWNDIWNMCQVPLHLLMLPDMTPTRSTRELCTNVPNVRMHVYVHVCLCVCVASGISSCLATIWVSLAGTVRAAEATHETCLLINTTMNHFTLPARGRVSWQNAFVSLHLHMCVYVCMYICGHMYCTHVCVVHYSVLCSLLLLLFFSFLLRFLWFVCDFHASFRLVCSFAFELRYKQAHRHSHTRTHARTQSNVLISCPFGSLSLCLLHNLRDSSFGFAWGLAPAYTHICSSSSGCCLCRCSSCHSPKAGRHVSLINTHKIHKFQNLDLRFYCIFKLWKYVCTHFSYLSHISYKISGYICCMPNRHRKCAVGKGARGNFDRVVFHFDCTLKYFTLWNYALEFRSSIVITIFC